MISNSYRKLLSKIEKGKVIRESLSNKDLDYLYDLGYIEMIVYSNPNDPFVQPYLTDHGKAYLEEYRRQRRRFLYPTVIALIGVIAGFIA